MPSSWSRQSTNGNEHRSQICSAVGALGDEAPELDAWGFWLTGYVAPDR
jgi:hypothetical protein